MKQMLRPALLVLALLAHADAAFAREGPPAWSGPSGEKNPPAAEMAALHEFLRMSDAQLGAMAAAIERVRQLSPQERRQLEKQIASFRRLPVKEREQIRSGWASEDDWGDWRTMMQSLTAEERSAIQETLQSMPFDQRAAHKHALLEAWRAEQNSFRKKSPLP
jgi:hypothetical protein